MLMIFAHKAAQEQKVESGKPGGSNKRILSGTVKD